MKHEVESNETKWNGIRMEWIWFELERWSGVRVEKQRVCSKTKQQQQQQQQKQID